MANALTKQANYAEAEEQYRNAVKLAADDETLISVYDNWGHRLGRTGLHKEAEEKFRKALEIKTDILLLCGVASELADQGRLDEARNLYLRGDDGPKDTLSLAI